ncbi:S-layer homology domain-containing protein [Ureibacillus composti]
MKAIIKIIFISLLVIFSLIPLNSTKASTQVFSDVPMNYSYYDDIMYLLDKGVIMSATKYGVSDIVTREEVAVMVAKAVGLDGTPRGTKFSDVPKSNPNSGYIQSAYEKGILGGYPDGTLKPKNKVTRGQMAVFIANAFKLPNGTKTFKDLKEGQTGYKQVKQLAAAGITSGYEDGTFKPGNHLTRAHISVFLSSAIQYANGESIKEEGNIPAPNLDNMSTSSPFHGTIFIEPNIITENDPSSFVNLAYMGKGNRVMYDRRVSNWIEVNAYLFNASYSNGNIIEIQVNPEFQSVENAQFEAIRFAKPIGQLPAFLTERVLTVSIHSGDNPFGGGNNNLLIHTDQAEKYISQGILEETIFHEATHTSIDPIYSENNEWIKAQRNDGNFISSYASENPSREDLAESLLLYFALKHRSDRLSQEMINLINKTMPHRIEFFEQQNFDVNK